VEIGERAILGGLVGIHQFVRVGKLAMIAACSKATQDVIPFSSVFGSPARLYGLNSVGLKRAGIASEVQKELKRAFHLLFEEALSREEALKEIQKNCGESSEVKELVAFIESAKRGICRKVQQLTEEPSWND
jgi:UDP-N-acetylglucosamine acyltransferase